MNRLIGRIERLEERSVTSADHAEDARQCEAMVQRLASRLVEADRFASERTRAQMSPAQRAAWLMRFRGEPFDVAVRASFERWNG